MPFKETQFDNANLVPREKKIPVPSLADFFDGDPVWTIRGLTGNEVGWAREQIDKSSLLASIAEGLMASSRRPDTVKKVRELVGLDASVPRDVALRMHFLVAGSVDPVCDLERAVKLSENFTIVFSELTTEIIRLTGLGHMPGKLNPSLPITE